MHLYSVNKMICPQRTYNLTEIMGVCVKGRQARMLVHFHRCRPIRLHTWTLCLFRAGWTFLKGSDPVPPVTRKLSSRELCNTSSNIGTMQHSGPLHLPRNPGATPAWALHDRHSTPEWARARLKIALHWLSCLAMRLHGNPTNGGAETLFHI